MNAIKEKIREFLNPFFKNYDLQDDEDIFATSFVNSLFAMQLVLFIEKAYGINLFGNDFEFNNLKSISSIAELITAKTVESC